DVHRGGAALPDSLRGVLLAGYEVQRADVALAVAFDERRDLRVGGLQRSTRPRRDRHVRQSVLRTIQGLMNKPNKVAWRKHRVKAKKREEKERTGAIARRG